MRIDPDIAQKLVEKVDLVMGKEILIANENGFLLIGGEKGDFSVTSYDAVRKGIKSAEEGTGYVWLPIYYEEKAIGAFGINAKNISEESLYLIQGMAEVLVHQEFLVKNLFSVTDIRTNFIKELLLTENIKNMNEAISGADVLKINLRANQAAIIAHIENFAENFLKKFSKLNEEEKKLEFIDYAQEAELLIKKAFKDYDQNVVIYFGDDSFVILKGMGSGNSFKKDDLSKFIRQKAKYLDEVLKKNFKNQKITLGVGQFYPDISGLRKSFQDAVMALDIGTKVWGKGKIYHILDVGTFASLSGDISHERKSEIAEQVLKPLLGNPDLLKTVQVFLTSGMNLTFAAKELHVHRNTLIYRLSKVKRMIGLDPKKFHDALQIKLGFMMRSLG